jgi:hypothetical protein
MAKIDTPPSASGTAMDARTPVALNGNVPTTRNAAKPRSA